MKQRSTQKKLLETSSTTSSVWNWKNSKNKRSKNQRKKNNVSKRSSNKPLMQPVADYSAAEEVKFLYESKSGKTTRNSMNFYHNSMNFDHQQIQLPAIPQWAILPPFNHFYFFKTKLIQAVNAPTKYLYCLLG